MAQRKLRFAIFGNTYQSKKSVSVGKVIGYLRRREAEVCIDRPFHDFLTNGMGMCLDGTKVFEGSGFDADYAISVGGDGTFLKTAACVGAKQTPIIGVNTGRLGFLADVLPGDTDTALDAIFEGRYTIESHSVIQAEACGKQFHGCPYALNEIAVLKRDNASMISIRVRVDGEYLVTYQADGLIVATPTGSTAYSLSNGGPIMMPRTNTLCLTPVAPHSLNIRPIVISDASSVELSVRSRSHNILLAFDGRSCTLTEGTTITISKASYTTNIVKRSGRSYFASLHEKMMWGADLRGE